MQYFGISRRAFLRWYYPDQVIRVSSQPLTGFILYRSTPFSNVTKFLLISKQIWRDPYKKYEFYLPQQSGGRSGIRNVERRLVPSAAELVLDRF